MTEHPMVDDVRHTLGSPPRLASDTAFPYGYPYGYPGYVCYFELAGGELGQCRTRGDLRDAVRRALDSESTVYAVWPGQHRSDLFVIDDLPALAREIGVEL